MSSLAATADNVRVVVLDMRDVPTMDATALIAARIRARPAAHPPHLLRHRRSATAVAPDGQGRLEAPAVAARVQVRRCDHAARTLSPSDLEYGSDLHALK